MENRIDTRAINEEADLLALAGMPLKRVASTGGGEWAGPCPICGGRDRFRVEPRRGIWLCRYCTGGKWQDAISLARLLSPGESFRAVCERLAGSNGIKTLNQPASQSIPLPADTPPESSWQERAALHVETCKQALWQPAGARALAYLRGRGLKDSTIRHFQLGYRHEPRAIVIPCYDPKGAIWYVKYRLPVGEPKYVLMPGSRPKAVYNASDLIGKDKALLVEGEFDAMLAWQECGDLLPVATLGSATNLPDLATWGRYFYAKQPIYLCYDQDEPGQEGAAKIKNTLANCISIHLPHGSKDINAYHLAGGNLRTLMMDILNGSRPESK